MVDREKVQKTIDEIVEIQKAYLEKRPRPDIPIRTPHTLMKVFVPDEDEDAEMKRNAINAIIHSLGNCQRKVIRYGDSSIDMKRVKEKSVDLIMKIVED